MTPRCFFANTGPCDGQLIKLCECGCGAPTPLATKTSRAQGYVKGEPMRFVHGHGSRGRTFPERRVSQRKPILRACVRCGVEFDAKSNAPSRKFCSQACYTKAQHKRVERVCEGCGKRFIAKESEVRRGGGRYCDRACWSRHATSPALRPGARQKISESKRGAKNASFKTGLIPSTVYRNGINLKAKGEDVCRSCRAKPAIHLHHVIPRSMWRGGIRDLRNCIPLCGRCHMGWHRSYVTIYRDVFTPEEWAFIASADLLGQNVTAWLDRRYPVRRQESEAA